MNKTIYVHAIVKDSKDRIIEELKVEKKLILKENNQLKEKVDRAISFIYLLKNNIRDYKTEYKEDFLNMLDDIGNILGGNDE